MAIGKATIRSVERAIRATADAIVEELEDFMHAGADKRLYQYRQTLLLLAKVRGSFEPELLTQELGAVVSEPLGFQTCVEPDDGEDEIESDSDAPEARLIGFRPKA